MNKDDVKRYSGLDWKAIGYITSIFSVFFLGAIAWPKPEDPDWHVPVLVVGIAASVLGMGFRYLAHIHQKKEISDVKVRPALNRSEPAQHGDRHGQGK